MKENYRPLSRLQTYMLWLTNGPFRPMLEDFNIGISMNKLNELTGIPLPIIRKDFLCMIQWQIKLTRQYSHQSIPASLIKYDSQLPDGAEYLLPINIMIDEDCLEFRILDGLHNISTLYEQLWAQNPDAKQEYEFDKFLMEGVLDNLPFFRFIEYDTSDYQLQLNTEESSVLQSLHHTDTSLSRKYREVNTQNQRFIMVKESYTYVHNYNQLYEKLSLFNNAIDMISVCKIRYGTTYLDSVTLQAAPLFISYDSTEHLYALIALADTTLLVLRLDKILYAQSVQATVDKEQYQSTKSHVTAIAPNVWGNCFLDTPEQVRVYFVNEGNVWQKARSVLEARVNGRLYEKDNLLYYEDTVYGISKFRSWIMGFGSSAVVLQPESLRNHILDSLKERKPE